MEKAIIITATGLTAAALYAVLNGSIASIVAELAVTGITITLTFVNPGGAAHLTDAAPGAAPVSVKGTAKSTKPVDNNTLQVALTKAINKVDGVKIPGGVTVQVQGKAAALNGSHGEGEHVDSVSLRAAYLSDTPTAGNSFGVKMTNGKSIPMFAQLFQGFLASPAEGVAHVPWKVGDTMISGTQSQTAKWTVQYGICYGQTSGEGGFLLSDGKPCQLGDVGTLTIENKQIKLEITSGGAPGAISCVVDSGFPSNYYIGFGIIPQEGSDVTPSGVTPTSGGMTTVFTPKLEYSVNFTTSTVDMGLYTQVAFSKFANFNWTGTSNNFETCVFQESGEWILTASQKVFANRALSFKSKANTRLLHSGDDSEDHNTGDIGQLLGPVLSIPTNRLSKLTLEYFD